ncbi:MAG: helix-turn-helix domain-containing protein [Rhodothermales bacterium]|nr:helix-turn-helix domain-containing protein [Rhodothermales bacterium]MBO6779877.1 helix-turn-helix domain-containing protein [Rhodothermales bacterium]
MAVSEDNLRFILGLKVKKLRQAAGLSLKQLAAGSGLSISYLSEIEKGKKYPKPEKLLGIAQALEVPYDELVSVRVDAQLDPLTQTLRSPFFAEFPFDVFGLEAQDLFALFSEDPSKAGALVRTLLEIGQMYDMRVEHFLFAALRSYQLMHDNYFAEIEDAAAGFRSQVGVDELDTDPLQALTRTLERVHNYRLDWQALGRTPELRDMRSVFSDGPNPTLYVNPNLLPSQKAFQLGRELAYHVMGLEARATTSSWLKVESFEQVLNNFKASYFAGAVLLDRDQVVDAMSSFFSLPTWQPEALLDVMDRFSATTEMFFYRLGQVLPGVMGLQDTFFMRLAYDQRSGRTRLSKVFNRTGATLPQGFWQDEHYCARWAGQRLLASVEPGEAAVRVRAQRSRFLDNDQDFFVMAASRPLRLSTANYSCVSLGLQMDEQFRRTVAFAEDPNLPVEIVNVTCQRCPLGPSDCRDRRAEATLYSEKSRLARREAAINELLNR